MQELYSGSRELFKGLWIEDKWDWSRKHPVIRITLTGIGYPEVSLPEALNYKLNTLIEAAGFPAAQGTPGNRPEYLIARLSAKGKVVVFIDEYDAPVIYHLGKDLAKAMDARDMLKEFYTVLKNNDHLLELVFLTGVSKFSKVGIFSGLNNLQDISLHPAYATMLGYTQEELEENFAGEIAAAQLQLDRAELLAQMKHWYNGYRFEENAERVYILEFKLNQSPEAALEQIRQKRYHQAFWNLGKPVVAVGRNFSSKTRNIEEWKAETVDGA